MYFYYMHLSVYASIYHFALGILSFSVGKFLLSLKHEFQGESPYLPY